MAVANAASQRKRRGRVGGELYRQSGGVTVVSELSLGPTGDPTLIQEGNRAAFGMLVAIGRLIRSAIVWGFKEAAGPRKPGRGRQGTWGAFMGLNRKYTQGVFDYTVPNIPVFDPENLLVAKGSIESTDLLTAVADVSTGILTVTYPTTTLGAGQTVDDNAIYVVYNETSNLWGVNALENNKRADGGGNFVLATFGVPFIITDVIRVYLFFKGYTDNGIDPVFYNGTESDSTNFAASVVA